MVISRPCLLLEGACWKPLQTFLDPFYCPLVIIHVLLASVLGFKKYHSAEFNSSDSILCSSWNPDTLRHSNTLVDIYWVPIPIQDCLHYLGLYFTPSSASEFKKLFSKCVWERERENKNEIYLFHHDSMASAKSFYLEEKFTNKSFKVYPCSLFWVHLTYLPIWRHRYVS